MRAFIATLGMLVAACAGAATPARQPLTAAQIVERATPSIVLIKVPDGVGSGFVVGEGGRIATNLHVIRGAKQASIVTSDERELEDVEVVAVDERHDLAVLRVKAPDLKPLPLGNSGAVKAGERVVAIGHPLGLGNTVSDGLVSAVRAISADLTVLQISAPISPGSSGGPLFNDRGEVIGIATLVATRGQNLNFGMPIDALKPMLTTADSVPIAEFAAKSAPRRNVPTHPLSILQDCPTPQLRSIVERILGAIEIGAPLYNEGNYEACYRIYADAALQAQSDSGACAGPRRALLEGVSNSDKLDDWGAKAWAMRDAFDGVLEVVERSRVTLGSGGTAPGAVQGRNVPRHPDRFLENCAAEDVGRIRDGISAAIASGAPLYNAGNVEACFRIYEGAIRDIDRKSACAAAKRALHDGLHNAEQRADWAAKAWALRDAFDGMLEVIERN